MDIEKELLNPKIKDDSPKKQFGIDQDPAIVVAGDWMATGPMVEMAFPTFVATGNPQMEIMERDPKIILSEIFSELTDSKIIFPLSESDIHKTIAGEGEYSKLLNKEIFDKLIKSKVEQMVGEGAAYVFPYQCFKADFDFFEKFGLKIMGPRNLSIRDLLANKIHFYEFVKRSGVEAIPGGIANNVEEAMEMTREFGEVFITKERGAGGIGSYHISSPEEVENKLGGYRGRMLVLKWMKKVLSSQNVLAIVPKGEIRPDEVAVVNVSDQIIEEDGTTYGGNTFPCSLPEKEFDILVEMTQVIGAELAKNGYSGIFGLDSLTVKEGDELKVYPVETNLRINHSHGLTAFLQSKLRPDLPSIACMHAVATLTDQWVDNKVLNQFPLEQKKIPSLVMRVVRFMGWMETTKLPKIEGHPIGFPPPGWMIPKSDINIKAGPTGNWHPLFVGRILSSAENRKEATKKSTRSRLGIYATYERV